MRYSPWCPKKLDTTERLHFSRSAVSNSCDPTDCSPPGFSVHWILQERIPGGLPFPPLEDLPNPGTEPGSPALQADSLPTEQ